MGQAAISSNQDLLAYLGVTEELGANYIGRARASIDRAPFSLRDVILLRELLHLQGRSVEEDPVIEFVHLLHGDDGASGIRMAFDRMSAPPVLDSFENLIVILPHIGGLQARIQFIRELLPLPGALTFLTSGPLEETDLRALLGEDVIAARNPPSFKWGDVVGALETMVLGDPMSETGQAYRVTERGYLASSSPNTAVSVFAALETGLHSIC